jgi:hypothetical protein
MSRQRLGTQQPTVIQKERGVEASLMPDSEMLLTVWNGDLEPSQYYCEEKALENKNLCNRIAKKFQFSSPHGSCIETSGVQP